MRLTLLLLGTLALAGCESDDRPPPAPADAPRALYWTRAPGEEMTLWAADLVSGRLANARAIAASDGPAHPATSWPWAVLTAKGTALFVDGADAMAVRPGRRAEALPGAPSHVEYDGPIASRSGDWGAWRIGDGVMHVAPLGDDGEADDVGEPLVVAAAWSPVVDRLAWVTATQVGVLTPGEVMWDFTIPQQLVGSWVRWSPDGRWVLAGARSSSEGPIRSGAWLVDARAGARPLIALLDAGATGQGVWSPDSKHVAILAGGLRVFAIDDGVVADRGTFPSGGDPFWLDTLHVATSAGLVVEVTTGTTIERAVGRGVAAPIPPGFALDVTRPDRTHEVVPLDGSPIVALDGCGNTPFVAWSPGGDEAACLPSPTTVAIVDRRTGAARTVDIGAIPRDDRPGVGRVTWAPDGTWFAVETDERRAAIVDVATATATPLHAGAVAGGLVLAR